MKKILLVLNIFILCNSIFLNTSFAKNDFLVQEKNKLETKNLLDDWVDLKLNHYQTNKEIELKTHDSESDIVNMSDNEYAENLRKSLILAFQIKKAHLESLKPKTIEMKNLIRHLLQEDQITTELMFDRKYDNKVNDNEKEQKQELLEKMNEQNKKMSDEIEQRALEYLKDLR